MLLIHQILKVVEDIKYVVANYKFSQQHRDWCWDKATTMLTQYT